MGRVFAPEIGQHPSVWLKVAVDGRDPSSGAHDQVLAPLRTHGLLIGAHGRIGVVLMRQRKDRDDPAPFVLVLQELTPVRSPQRHPAQEALRPVVRVGDAVLVFEHQRQMDIAGLQGLGDGIPVAHHQIEKVLELLLARESLLISHLAAAPDLGQILTGMHTVGAADQGREEPIQLFKVHRTLPVEPVEGVCKAVVFRIRQRSLTHGLPLRVQSELTIFSVVRSSIPFARDLLSLRIACPATHLMGVPHDQTDHALAPAHARRHGPAQHVARNPARLHQRGEELQRLLRPIAGQADLRGRAHLPAPSRLTRFRSVVDAAHIIRDRLLNDGITAWPMLSGGKGIHVVVPLTGADWPSTSAYAKQFAEALERDAPQQFTSDMAKADRQGRIFVDYLRNERGLTAVMPYSTRAKAVASVAMPLDWEQLGSIESAQAFTVRRILEDGPLQAADWAQIPQHL